MFAGNGYKIVVNYCKLYEKALELHSTLTQKEFEAIMYQADVSERSQVENMIHQCLGCFGRIDVLVNNAGIAEQKMFHDISECDWDNMLNVNVKGMFNCLALQTLM